LKKIENNILIKKLKIIFW